VLNFQDNSTWRCEISKTGWSSRLPVFLFVHGLQGDFSSLISDFFHLNQPKIIKVLFVMKDDVAQFVDFRKDKILFDQDDFDKQEIFDNNW